MRIDLNRFIRFKLFPLLLLFIFLFLEAVASHPISVIPTLIGARVHSVMVVLRTLWLIDSCLKQNLDRGILICPCPRKYLTPLVLAGNSERYTLYSVQENNFIYFRIDYLLARRNTYQVTEPSMQATCPVLYDMSHRPLLPCMSPQNSEMNCLIYHK
ncbi:hypothetical protein V8C37DRAFT_314172 [Trichoderma ceciliae]